MANIKFARKDETVILPTKRDEDMGYDIYANFEEPYMIIKPHNVVLIPTGLYSACDDDYGFILKERGSTGTKGMAVRCGVIDSGYRDQWFIPISNITNQPIIIVKKEYKDNFSIEDIQEGMSSIPEAYGYYGKKLLYKNKEIMKFGIGYNEPIFYPYEKAICQAIVVPVPRNTVEETTIEELQAISSERGTGALGSSSK